MWMDIGGFRCGCLAYYVDLSVAFVLVCLLKKMMMHMFLFAR